MGGELVPDEVSGGLGAGEKEGVKSAVEPALGVVGIPGEEVFGLEVLGGAVVAGADDGGFAEEEGGGGEILLGERDGLDDAGGGVVAVILGEAAPLAEMTQGGHGVGVGGGDADVVGGDVGCALDLLFEVAAE